MIETDIWPFVPAKFFTAVPKTQRRAVRVIVMHDMEAPEKGDTAEAIARYFRDMPDNRPASAHVCVDNNSIVQCVHDNNVANAAPGCNNDGIQIELAGYGNQTRAQWLDEYGLGVLDLGALAAAQYCLKYDIPAVHLTNDQLRAGQRGIIGHYQASEVYQKSDHTDPGPNFPWDDFMCRVVAHVEARRKKFGIVA